VEEPVEVAPASDGGTEHRELAGRGHQGHAKDADKDEGDDLAARQALGVPDMNDPKSGSFTWVPGMLHLR